MTVKFKLASTATKESVTQMLGLLAHQGLKADRLFPEQTRPSLANMYVIRSPKAKVSAVEKVLEPFGNEVEYIEGEATRKPLS